MSSGSSTGPARGTERRAARVSVSPSVAASSRRTAAGSGRSRGPVARPSASSCRSRARRCRRPRRRRLAEMVAGALVLVIEDEPQMRRFLRAMLRANAYQVVEAETAREGLAQAAGRNPEVILLDLGLPDADGVEVARQLRRSTRAPIIVISARGKEQDKVAALDNGADDYLTKPFGAPELLARIRVALRRATAPDDGLPTPVFTSGELRVDLLRREVLRGGEPVHLTPTEYKLLAALIRNPG